MKREYWILGVLVVVCLILVAIRIQIRSAFDKKWQTELNELNRLEETFKKEKSAEGPAAFR